MKILLLAAVALSSVSSLVTINDNYPEHCIIVTEMGYWGNGGKDH